MREVTKASFQDCETVGFGKGGKSRKLSFRQQFYSASHLVRPYQIESTNLKRNKTPNVSIESIF
jgi:hypothetical protein